MPYNTGDTQREMQNEVFAVWKPKGPTSNDMVDVFRKFYKTRAVGHGGTLDPLAEGILLIGVGRAATKKLHAIENAEKEYVAEITLGATSTTDDAEGAKTEARFIETPTREALEKVLRQHVGTADQTPPVYSALKVQGKPAYKRVRSGESVVLAARQVVIHSIELQHYEYPVLKIRVVTGPGVYIRALARDIGVKLGGGAYLSALMRTRVGQFTKPLTVPLPENKA